MVSLSLQTPSVLTSPFLRCEVIQCLHDAVQSGAQNGTQFKTYELFISGIVRVIFSEITESKTTDKEELLHFSLLQMFQPSSPKICGPRLNKPTLSFNMFAHIYDIQNTHIHASTSLPCAFPPPFIHL